MHVTYYDLGVHVPSYNITRLSGYVHFSNFSSAGCAQSNTTATTQDESITTLMPLPPGNITDNATSL